MPELLMESFARLHREDRARGAGASGATAENTYVPSFPRA
jgi:hypothetical protein